ncbi:hypothetical protein JHK87_018852 [Glycine soja]|nr:hypothetical protein JHK87_018852 [Glycine soja]
MISLQNIKSLQTFPSLGNMSRQSQGSILREVATLLWSIWCRRNGKIWENMDITIVIVVHCANQVLRNWESARQKTSCLPMQQVHHLPLQKLPSGLVKCNTDVAMFTNQVNALALPEAINWMADLGYNRAIIESDCKWIIEGIKGDGIEHTNLGVIICL